MNGINLRALLRFLLVHPWRLPVVAIAGWRLRRRRWWLRAPFLPLPDGHYWHFRMITAVGERGGPLSDDEVVSAATWSRRQRSERER